MNRWSSSTSKATPTTLCQKCLKKGHYSYECTASQQDRPYVSRPSRTQVLKNPKIAPRITSVDDAPKTVDAPKQRLITSSDAHHARSPSASSDSVTTVSTNRSRSRSKQATTRKADDESRRSRARSTSSAKYRRRGQPHSRHRHDYSSSSEVSRSRSRSHSRSHNHAYRRGYNREDASDPDAITRRAHYSVTSRRRSRSPSREVRPTKRERRARIEHSSGRDRSQSRNRSRSLSPYSKRRAKSLMT